MKRFVVFEKLLKKEPDIKRVVLGDEEKAKGVTVIHCLSLAGGLF
jgi:hypothetical protein